MALDWLPTYPDRSHRPRTQGRTVLVQNLDPIPTDPPPTDWPLPAVYPDRLRVAPRLAAAAQPFFSAWPMVPIADLRWAPTYPNQLRRERLGAARTPAFFSIFGTQQAIAVTGAWRPSYPDRLTRLPRRTGGSAIDVYGQSRWVVDPRTLLTAASCVEWDETSLLRSTLAESTTAVVRPSMLSGTGQGYLLNEDGSFLLLEDGGLIELEDSPATSAEQIVRSQMVEEDLC